MKDEPALSVRMLQNMLVALARNSVRGLTVKQLTLFLVVYSAETPYSVKELAQMLHLNKSTVTRSFDVLGQLNLTRRDFDPKDKRIVIARRTKHGEEFLARLHEWM